VALCQRIDLFTRPSTTAVAANAVDPTDLTHCPEHGYEALRLPPDADLSENSGRPTAHSSRSWRICRFHRRRGSLGPGFCVQSHGYTVCLVAAMPAYPGFNSLLPLSAVLIGSVSRDSELGSAYAGSLMRRWMRSI